MQPTFPPGMPLPPGMQAQAPTSTAPSIKTPPRALTAADAALLNADLGYDPEADANSTFLPVPPSGYLWPKDEAAYEVTASFASPDPAQQVVIAFSHKTKKEYTRMDLVLTIQNCITHPELNGRQVRYMATSMVSPFNQTSSMQSIIQATPYGEQLKTLPRTTVSLIKCITALVQNKAVIRAIVDWEGYDEESKTTIKSWKMFPKTPSGEPIPVVTVTTPFGPKDLRAMARASFITFGSVSNGPKVAASFDPSLFTQTQPQPVSQAPVVQQQQQQTQPQTATASVAQPAQAPALDINSLFKL